jgi:hypothetical protein
MQKPFSGEKKNIFFLLSLLKQRPLPRIVHAFGERFKTCFWNENHPELFASPSTMLSGTQKSLA